MPKGITGSNPVPSAAVRAPPSCGVALWRYDGRDSNGKGSGNGSFPRRKH
ncbi:MAG: hypothetical protein Q7S84_04675 [bacterium]|nr:hypothetical protein [bacterium]